MSIEITLLTNLLSIDPPPDWIGWLGLILFVAVVSLLLWHWRGYNKSFPFPPVFPLTPGRSARPAKDAPPGRPSPDPSSAALLTAPPPDAPARARAAQRRASDAAPTLPIPRVALLLLALLPFTTLFIGLRLPPGDALPPPGRPIDPGGPIAMLFLAVPCAIAAGLLGPWAAALLAFLSGLGLMLWDTHSLFTPFELALLAAAWGAALQQRYRTLLFQSLRRPLVAALALSASYLLLYWWRALSSVTGDLVIRLDYALTHLGWSALSVALTLAIAGLFAEGIALALPHLWGGKTPLQPSPFERTLQARFLVSLSPLAFALLAFLIGGDWWVANRAAYNMLQSRLADTAHLSVEILPFYLQTGQNLIQELAADPLLLAASPADLSPLLQTSLRRAPFFSQLFILDQSGAPLAGYPNPDYAASPPSTDELLGIQRASAGVPVQVYPLPPLGDAPAQVVFIARLLDAGGQPQGVLVGRSDLASNPLIQPLLTNLQSFTQLGGDGLLLDDQGRVLYHSNAERWLDTYTKPDGAENFYEDRAPDGTRRLVYYQPAPGHPWAVVLALPARQAQQVALSIAAPLLLVVLLLFLLAAFILRLGLRRVTASLETLSAEAHRIAAGELENPLSVQGVDEVGALRRSFEQMRSSLKARLDELNLLLAASQGVASSLEMERSIRSVLEASLSTRACAARVVLEPAAVPDLAAHHAPLKAFAAGRLANTYADLDEQILASTRQQDRLVLAGPARTRSLAYPSAAPRLEAVVALALRHESLYYGALYLLFDAPHQLTDDEMRFLITLSGHAALAAANARLFLSAEIGRQRLEAILASTPDPVLVTDHLNRLLLANPAAWQTVGFVPNASLGQPIDQILAQKELVQLLSYSNDQPRPDKPSSAQQSSVQQSSAEVSLKNARIYLATASSVIAGGAPVGRVCVMRDITHFKELDALKSEFVSTVSHDLRSPLTLMRGYATMLEMVGNLNEQQMSYVRKIVASVETMSRLVNNLLDLGRIEAGLELQIDMVSINDVVERVIGALQLLATQKKIQLNTELASNLPLIEADQSLLQQALYNLVENGIKYTEIGGRLSVRVRQDAVEQIPGEPGRMLFEVQDTGIGIPAGELSRLFEKFYRGAQREAIKQKGSGLGLAIVKSIADRHHGRVWVESQLGKGSTFYLAVPLRQPRRERSGEAPKR